MPLPSPLMWGVFCVCGRGTAVGFCMFLCVPSPLWVCLSGQQHLACSGRSHRCREDDVAFRGRTKASTEQGTPSGDLMSRKSLLPATVCKGEAEGGGWGCVGLAPAAGNPRWCWASHGSCSDGPVPVASMLHPTWLFFRPWWDSVWSLVPATPAWQCLWVPFHVPHDSERGLGLIAGQCGPGLSGLSCGMGSWGQLRSF